MKHFEMITLARVRELQDSAKSGDLHLVMRSFTVQELLDLLRFAQDHLLMLSEYVKDDDVMALTQLQVGDIVTPSTIAGIANLFAMHEDGVETDIERFETARRQVARDIGGDELVRVMESEDRRSSDLACSRALEAYYKKLAQRDARVQKDSN